METVKDFIIPLALSMVLGAFGGAASVVWWGIRRMVTGQDLINHTLTEIRDNLGETVSRVVRLETIAQQTEKMTDERHQENKRELNDLWSAVHARSQP